MKFLKPDKDLAFKYILAGFLLFITDFLTGYVGIIAALLLAISVKPFRHDQNKHFDKTNRYFLCFAGSYLIYFILFILIKAGVLTGKSYTSLCYMIRALVTVFFIYGTHYFNEAIIVEARISRVNYIKLGLNTPWILLGLATMLSFVSILVFKQPIPSICAAIAIGMCIYYCIVFIKAYPVIFHKHD